MISVQEYVNEIQENPQIMDDHFGHWCVEKNDSNFMALENLNFEDNCYFYQYCEIRYCRTQNWVWILLIIMIIIVMAGITIVLQLDKIGLNVPNIVEDFEVTDEDTENLKWKALILDE